MLCVDYLAIKDCELFLTTAVRVCAIPMDAVDADFTCKQIFVRGNCGNSEQIVKTRDKRSQVVILTMGVSLRFRPQDYHLLRYST